MALGLASSLSKRWRIQAPGPPQGLRHRQFHKGFSEPEPYRLYQGLQDAAAIQDGCWAVACAGSCRRLPAIVRRTHGGRHTWALQHRALVGQLHRFAGLSKCTSFACKKFLARPGTTMFMRVAETCCERLHNCPVQLPPPNMLASSFAFYK